MGEYWFSLGWHQGLRAIVGEGDAIGMRGLLEEVGLRVVERIGFPEVSEFDVDTLVDLLPDLGRLLLVVGAGVVGSGVSFIQTFGREFFLVEFRRSLSQPLLNAGSISISFLVGDLQLGFIEYFSVRV